MDDDYDAFDCYELHFQDDREKCIKCSAYHSCIQQKILDLLIIIGMEEKWNEIF